MVSFSNSNMVFVFQFTVQILFLGKQKREKNALPDSHFYNVNLSFSNSRKWISSVTTKLF